MPERWELLKVLVDLRQQRRLYEARVLDAVRQARASNLSWQEIGDSLGINRSVVWKKYHDQTS